MENFSKGLMCLSIEWSLENTNSRFENTNSSFENTNSSFENTNSSFENTNSSSENTNSSDHRRSKYSIKAFTLEYIKSVLGQKFSENKDRHLALTLMV